MRALSILVPNISRVIETDAPRLVANEILIRVKACGICGTDVHIFRGEYLGDYPITPGHEFSGVVEAVGEGVRRFRPGDRVAVEPNLSCQNCHACLSNRENFCENWQAVGVTRPGGMAELVCVPESAVFDIHEMPFEVGAFVEPLACVLHGLQQLRIEPGDSAVVLGAGPIGLLLLQAVLGAGASMAAVVEQNEARRKAAYEFGAAPALASLENLEGDDYDRVIDATGVPRVMERTLDFVRPGGSILLFGVPPSGTEVRFDAFKIFRKGLTILSSFTSRRNSYQAVRLLRSGIVRVEPLISHRLGLEDFEKGVGLIEAKGEDVKKIIITPNP